METFQIEFQPSVKEKILEFLNSFSKNELKIIVQDPIFEETKKRLHESYRKLQIGETKLYDIDELDVLLDKIISEYEK